MANTLPLSFYRLRFLGIEIYECVNGFNPTYLNDLFTAQANDYHLRDSSRLIQPKFNTFKVGCKSFRYSGAKLWNVLPIDIKRSESLSVFKKYLTGWCHSDAAKALEREMFWSIHFCMLSLHSLINVADILDHSAALLCSISSSYLYACTNVVFIRSVYVDFKDQVISFTVIHRIFRHMSIYVPYSSHVIVHVTFVKLS